MKKLRVISCFAGIGGFDLAAEQAGLEVVAHVEKDANCRRLLAARFPNALAFDDICTVGTHNLPPCDVLCGGWPCQDLSVAGLRAGLVSGSRSSLFYELTRLIRELRPRYFLGENVPGLLSSDERRDFARVLGELANCGKADLAWRTLNAQWFGVAQRRRRVFVVADFGGERAGEILSLSESMRGDSPPSREAGKEIAGTLGSRTEGGGMRTTDLDGHGAYVLPAVADCLQERDSKGCDSNTKNGHLIVSGNVNSGQGYWREDEKAGTLGTESRAVHENNLISYNVQSQNSEAMRGGGRAQAANETQIARCVDSAGFTSQQGGTLIANLGPELSFAFKPSRFTRDKDGAPSVVFPPLSADADKGDQEAVVLAYRTGGNCGPFEQGDKTGALNTATDPSQNIIATRSMVRRLTPRECERLQGFPDDWTAGFSDSTRYRMLGNAVSVPVVRWIVRRLAHSSKADPA